MILLPFPRRPRAGIEDAFKAAFESAAKSFRLVRTAPMGVIERAAMEV